jgi:hypothetical protein
MEEISDCVEGNDNPARLVICPTEGGTVQRCHPPAVPLQYGWRFGLTDEPGKSFVETTVDVQDINIEAPYFSNEWQGEVAAESEEWNREGHRKNLDPKRLGLNNGLRPYRLMEEDKGNLVAETRQRGGNLFREVVALQEVGDRPPRETPSVREDVGDPHARLRM